FVGKTLLHGDVLMWLMKTLLTSGCTNQRGAGQLLLSWQHWPMILGTLHSGTQGKKSLTTYLLKSADMKEMPKRFVS
ncbi:hypothetical protein, partial [Atlantibacter hermannii]|uniref:hypothetical protein n=1 Tax=Atlantibacter hermannii TaxID=565 RepID=UPI0036F46E0A